MMKMEHKPSEKHLRTLQNIVGDNPWFAIGQQLLACEIQKLDNQNFEKYLQKAAIYTINREILYKNLYAGNEHNITDESHENVAVEIQNIIGEPHQDVNLEAQDSDITIELEDKKEETPCEITEKPVFEYPVADYFESQFTNTNESSEDIIDKFLASPQKISAVYENGSFETTENVMTEPIINDDFVTETLAKIYVEQGYFSKAIDVYEKLSLQDSKKSIYFAPLIENLKKKSKN